MLPDNFLYRCIRQFIKSSIYPRLFINLKLLSRSFNFMGQYFAPISFTHIYIVESFFYSCEAVFRNRGQNGEYFRALTCQCGDNLR